MIFPERASAGRRRSGSPWAGRACRSCWRRARVAPSPCRRSPARRLRGVTKATIAWPVSSSGTAITAASATRSFETSADWTSIVERRWPGDVGHDVVDPPDDPEEPVLVAARGVADEVGVLAVAVPVRLHEAVRFLVEGARHPGPRLGDDERAAALGDLVAVLVEYRGLDAGQGEGRRARLRLVGPGSGAIMIPPVSVCHQVSTTAVLAADGARTRSMRGVDRLPDRASKRSDQIVLRRVLVAPFHAGADGGGGRVEDATP